MNCWISFVLYAVTGQMREADAVMKEHGAAVRRHAKRQLALIPIARKPIYRGVLLEDGLRPVSANQFFDSGDLGGVFVRPVPRADGSDTVVDEEGCVAHAIESMSFVSHSEDIECAQWFGSPESAVSGAVAVVHPGARGYIVRLEKPPTLVLWHHSWTSTRMPRGFRISLDECARQHPHIREVADQFVWNAKTQKEVITMPSSERYKLEPVGEVDVKALDRKFCHPLFLAQREAENA